MLNIDKNKIIDIYEFMNEFNYLGTVLSYTGNFEPTIEHVVGKSLVIKYSTV